MSKLQFEEFNTHQELTDFVNNGKIQPEDIVSINSITNSKKPFTGSVFEHPISFHLFYWSYEDEIEENKERDIQRQKSVDDYFRGRKKEY